MPVSTVRTERLNSSKSTTISLYPWTVGIVILLGTSITGGQKPVA
jgi:hypothetical protein